MEEENNRAMKISSLENGSLRILLLFFPWLLFLGGSQYLGVLLSRTSWMKPITVSPYGKDIIISFMGMCGTLLILWLFMKFIDRKKFKSLGFEFKNWWKNLLIGIVLGIIIMGLAYIVLISFQQISFKSIVYDPKEIFIAIGLFTFVAISEEVLFRGYILRNLHGFLKLPFALVSSSFLFALAHGLNPNLDWFGFLNLLLAGILLGFTYIYTKNLWFPIGLHFSWNLFQSFFGFNVSGQDYYSIIEYSYATDTIWNGGAFGFEGSIMAGILQIVLIICIFLFYNNSRDKLEEDKT